MGIIESIVNIITFVLVMSELEYDSEEERSLSEEPELESEVRSKIAEAIGSNFSLDNDCGFMPFLTGVTTTYFSTGCME